MNLNIRNRILLILPFLSISLNSSSQDLMIPGQYAWLYKAQYPYYDEKSGQNFESIPNVVTVDFQFHQGNAILTDGSKLSGWFKFAPFERRPSLPEGTILKQPDNIYYKPYISGAKEETIDEDKFLRLTLAGKDSDLLTDEIS